MRNYKGIAIFCNLLILLYITACSKNEDVNNQHNPNIPVTLEKFYPDSGGYSSRMIISGSNFGTDTSKITVFFNEKKASIVGTNGSKLYVVVPKLPGDKCVIKVKVGGAEKKFNETFTYHSSYSITTIAGKQGGNVTSMIDGSLADTEFSGYLRYLLVDGQGNLFGTQYYDHTFFMLNEQKGISKKLYVSTGPAINIPTINPFNQRIYMPSDGGEDYWESDPELQWSTKKLRILHPNDPSKDFLPINYKYGFAFNLDDGLVYTRSRWGEFIRFDPKNRLGEVVASLDRHNVQPLPLQKDGDSYHVFDPNNNDIIYIAYQYRHCIYTFNVRTLEHKLIAGTPGVPGHNDGVASNSEFKNPHQLSLDSEGNVYVADSGNHCIRKISKGMVTTVVGLPGTAGYVDGPADEALLRDPWGVAVDKNDDVYISDGGNRVIRKLSFQ